jgi:hypothetical protein
LDISITVAIKVKTIRWGKDCAAVADYGVIVDN